MPIALATQCTEAACNDCHLLLSSVYVNGQLKTRDQSWLMKDHSQNKNAAVESIILPFVVDLEAI